MEPARVVAWWLAAHRQGDMTAAAFSAALDDLTGQLPASQHDVRPALLDLVAEMRSAPRSSADARQKIDESASHFLGRVGFDGGPLHPDWHSR